MHACMHACMPFTHSSDNTHAHTNTARTRRGTCELLLHKIATAATAGSQHVRRQIEEGGCNATTCSSCARVIEIGSAHGRGRDGSPSPECRDSNEIIGYSVIIETTAAVPGWTPNAPNDNSAKIVVSLRLTDGSRGQSGEGYLSNRLTRIPRAAGEVL